MSKVIQGRDVVLWLWRRLADISLPFSYSPTMTFYPPPLHALLLITIDVILHSLPTTMWCISSLLSSTIVFVVRLLSTDLLSSALTQLTGHPSLSLTPLTPLSSNICITHSSYRPPLTSSLTLHTHRLRLMSILMSTSSVCPTAPLSLYCILPNDDAPRLTPYYHSLIDVNAIHPSPMT